MKRRRRAAGSIAREQGQVLVVSVLVLSLLLGLAALVVDLGDWYVHRRHLQTQVDAAALASGQAWAFPCDSSVDTAIEAAARKYVGTHRGRHVGASSTLFTTPYNDQLGLTDSSTNVHVVLNGGFWTDSSAPADFSGDGANVPAGSVCNSMTLQVDATENDTGGIFSGLKEDLHAKARVQMQEIDGLSGLLPIAVRTPKPQSVAAVFYNLNGNAVLDAKLLREASITGLPAGLGGWTNTGSSTQISFTMPASGQTGAVIGTSFAPACDATASPPITANCMSTAGFATVDDFCRQGGGNMVTCYYATGSGATQTVQSPLAFVRGYQDTSPTNTQPPQLESAWLTPAGCTDAYFNAKAAACTVGVNAQIDAGGRNTADIEVGVAGGSCGAFAANKVPDCVLAPTGTGNDWATSLANNPSIAILSNANPFSIRVRLRNTTVGGTACGGSFPTSAGPCVVVFPAPVQQTFMGSDDSTATIKYVHLTRTDSAGIPTTDPDPGSDPIGAAVNYVVDIGLRGAVATTAAEPPYAFNLKGSQSGLLDCDPSISNAVNEVIQGCSPKYTVNKLTRTPPCPSVSGANQFFNSPPAPYSTEWPPYSCVLTQTGNPTQLLTGFAQRVFGVNNASSCPADSSTAWVKGRNYWSNGNNLYTANTFENKNLRKDDPRLITLFLTGYGTFTGSGNETYPIVSFGAFYVTGWGQGDVTKANNIEDPCPGNSAPTDLIVESGGAYVWGHFINTVTIDPNANPSGNVCRPGVGFNPCIASLVE